MKRLSMLLAMVFAMISLPSFAHNNADDPGKKVIVLIKSVDNKVFNLTLANLQKEKTTISITDLAGNTTYYRTFVKNHNGFGKIINLENLPRGKYLLNIGQQKQKVVQVIVVREDGLLFSKGKIS